MQPGLSFFTTLEAVKMKNSVLVVKAIFIIIVVGWLITDKLIYPPLERLKDKYSLLSYDGVVARKFIDKNDHARRVVILVDGTRLSYPSNIDYLYSITEVGDTLRKAEGQLTGYLKKRDTTIVINYDIPTKYR